LVGTPHLSQWRATDFYSNWLIEVYRTFRRTLKDRPISVGQQQVCSNVF